MPGAPAAMSINRRTTYSIFTKDNTAIRKDMETIIEEHIITYTTDTEMEIVYQVDIDKRRGNHSTKKLDEINKTTDLDRCRILHKDKYDYENKNERRNSHYNREIERLDLSKNENVYGKQSTNKKRVEVDGYDGSRRAVNLKFKFVRDMREWVEALGRTMCVSVRVLTLLGLLLAILATSEAAPTRSRPARSTHHEINVRSYLETFGYLQKGLPENLLLEGDYEDDFRIAIKTLQEFGGIPVTGVIDEDTKSLLKQKRCGRPDREVGDEENVKRRKRFAVQGEKWRHTNLTWSLKSDRHPSQLDPYGTRDVLARALDVWEQASRLTFREINSDDADIVVSFAKRYHDDAYPFDGRGLILAHAFFPGTGRGGDAHFDDDELWVLSSNDDDEGTSLLAVAAHEFGHSLGLSHSSVKGALMFPWYQGIQPNFELPEDDRNGIQQMYGPKVRKPWARIPYYPVETPPPTTTTSTTTTTTTTRRPYHHHNRHNRPDHTPFPRPPNKYPTYYPRRPAYYPPDRRHYNTTEDHPRRTNHNHYPRPTPHETTTHPTTYRPVRYPTVHSDYPTYPRPNHPTDPRQDYPRKPYIPPRTTTTSRPTPPSDKPDTCNTSYDAVALIRGELFIFKNRYHWRIGAQGHYPGYPMDISRMWPGLPRDFTRVDAVYERPDRKIAFFIGKELFLFDTQNLLPGYPRAIRELGLPSSLEKLDAAMVWGHNGKTYFYSGSLYWKYDEEEGHVELDYPRDMSMWKGVGYNIDSVFQWKDGKTYFFKGRGFWKFNDLQMKVEHEKQLPSAPFWMGCPTERTSRRAPFRVLPAPGSTLRSPSAASARDFNKHLPLLSSAIVILLTFLVNKTIRS
ncbi:matrix metalloproteinase-2-like [Plodia interpunctella]|uniref:matrix metalloproteinase-2-like n=1 Tax=Plodia interpunctella TaxID=58824 RepID=UPI002368DBD3|nr:matrix metalloproteinase-2-like [Plodia interpunctella]